MNNSYAKRLYGIKDATFYLSISRAKLYKDISLGKIRILKNGSRTLIDISELDRYADSLVEKSSWKKSK